MENFIFCAVLAFSRKTIFWSLFLTLFDQIEIMPLIDLRRRGVVVITTAQLYSTKSELGFCADSNPARGELEIRDGEDL